jgi:ribosomal protein S18 acetylase RimI-like enzyme
MPDFANLPGFTLRELGPTDIPAFIELGLPTCVFMHGRSGVSDDKMLRHFSAFVHEYAFAKDGEIWVVEAPDHSIAAQLWLHHTQNRFNGLDELWIWDITVREDQRRQGIGRNLLEFAIQRAKENRTQELWLLVSSKNDRAVKIYGSRGLEDAGRLMRLSLTGSNPPCFGHLGHMTWRTCTACGGPLA